MPHVAVIFVVFGAHTAIVRPTLAGLNFADESWTSTNTTKRLDKNIPIVMMNVSDPVSSVLVTSLAHPEGNITGLVEDELAEITTKRLQLLKDAIPLTSRVAVLKSDRRSEHEQWKTLELRQLL